MVGEPYRVLVVDDGPIFIEGLSRHIEQDPDLELAGVAHTADEALRLCARRRPHLVVVDLRLPREFVQEQLIRNTDPNLGIELIRKIRCRWPDQTRILATSSTPEDPLVLQAIEAGAAGFVDRNVDPALFIKAMRRVLAGEMVLDVRHYRLLQERRSLRLTQRERDVLRYLCRGLTDRDIAAELNVGVRTVEAYVRSLREKFHARTRGEVAAKARRLGLC